MDSFAQPPLELWLWISCFRPVFQLWLSRLCIVLPQLVVCDLDSVTHTMHCLTTYLSTPPSSMASPLEDDSLLYFTSPDLLSHDSLSPFKVSEAGGQDLVVPALPHQGHTVAWPQPTDISHSIPPVQHLHQPTSLSGELVAVDASSIANQSLQGTVANNLCAVPGNFIAPPIFVETTALGLYYSDTTQSPDIPLISTEAEDSASVPCIIQHVAPSSARPTQNWTFRAVDPAAKVSRSKHVQSDEARSTDHVLTNAVTTTSHGAKVEPEVECRECGYFQLTKRMGDFRRHLKKHEADHLSRVVCCGVPLTHPAAASLRPGHLTHWYDGHPFYGGCGRSYSRMDALQRHLKKSGCISGSSKDHHSWRKLYFRDKTSRPHKSPKSSISSGSQKSSVLSPIYSPPRASSSLL
jgi:ribosomal protein S15P/S13E